MKSLQVLSQKTRLNSEKFQNFHFQAKIVIFDGNRKNDNFLKMAIAILAIFVKIFENHI